MGLKWRRIIGQTTPMPPVSCIFLILSGERNPVGRAYRTVANT
jgi:hypothetical protein